MDTIEVKQLIERCIDRLEQQIKWAKSWQSQTCLVRCGWTVILEQDLSWSLLEKLKSNEFCFSGEPTTTTYFEKEAAQKLAEGCKGGKGCKFRIIHMNELAEKVMAEYPERLESYKGDILRIDQSLTITVQ